MSAAKGAPAPDLVITSVSFAAKVTIGGERTDWWNDKRTDQLSRWRPNPTPMGMEFHEMAEDKPTGRVQTVPWAQILVWDRSPRPAPVAEVAA